MGRCPCRSRPPWRPWRSPRRWRAALLDGVGLPLASVDEDVAGAHLGELVRVSASKTFCSAASSSAEPATLARSVEDLRVLVDQPSWNDGGEALEGIEPELGTRRRRERPPRCSGVTLAPRRLVLLAWPPCTTISRLQRLAGEVGRHGVAAVARDRRLAGSARLLAMKAGLSANCCSESVNDALSIESPLTVAALGFTVEQAEPTSAPTTTTDARARSWNGGARRASLSARSHGLRQPPSSGAAARAGSRRPSTASRPSAAPRSCTSPRSALYTPSRASRRKPDLLARLEVDRRQPHHAAGDADLADAERGGTRPAAGPTASSASAGGGSGP